MTKAETVFLSLLAAYLAFAILGNVVLYFWFKHRESQEDMATIFKLYKDLYISQMMVGITNKWMVLLTIASYVLFFVIGWHTTVMVSAIANTVMMAVVAYYHMQAAAKSLEEAKNTMAETTKALEASTNLLMDQCTVTQTF